MSDIQLSQLTQFTNGKFMFDKILVICTGNICRSPIAERLLRQMMPTKIVKSAGLAALINNAADLTAQKIANKHGVSLDGHKGIKFTADIGRQYDLILVMEKHQIEAVSTIAPELRGKTMLLGHWMNQKEIPDPYRKSDEAFESVYILIDQACKLWTKKLQA